MAGLLYANEYAINDHISIRIPKVGDILDNEDKYYDIVCSIIATPYEMMVQLDDNGIDFTAINAFELFCIMFKHLKEIDTSMVFGDLNLSDFQYAKNEENENLVLWNPKTDVVIDRAIHDMICTFLRKMLYMPKSDKAPGNEEARKYMIERARIKQKRKKKKKKDSQLEKLIISLVNTAEFPYNYETVRDLTIYQFYASLKQISQKIRFDNAMIGCYAGTVKFDDLSQEEKTWIQIE